MTPRSIAPRGGFLTIGPADESRRPGRGLVEVIVIAAILGFAGLFLMMALPRGRETARMAGCQKNLMQVGVGLQMYHQTARHYPAVPSTLGPGGDGPIKAMLDVLVVPDLLEFQDPYEAAEADRGPPPREVGPRPSLPERPVRDGGFSVAKHQLSGQYRRRSERTGRAVPGRPDDDLRRGRGRRRPELHGGVRRAVGRQTAGIASLPLGTMKCRQGRWIEAAARSQQPTAGEAMPAPTGPKPPGDRPSTTMP